MRLYHGLVFYMLEDAIFKGSRLWSAQQGEEVPNLPRHESALHKLAISTASACIMKCPTIPWEL